MSEEQGRAGRVDSMAAELCAAVRFLTIVPLPWRIESDPENFSTCLRFFPVVGMLIGLLGSLISYLVLLLFPPSVAAVVALVYLAFISNCLHLDGVADCGDGLLSAKNRVKSLEIMKDSRVGAMGAIVVVFLLLAKFSALSALDPQDLYVVVFFMPIAGRIAIVATMATVPYGRAEGGLGGLFYNQSLSRNTAIISLFFFGMLLILFDFSRGILGIGLMLLGIFVFNSICRSKLGGATGDTLGANCEIAEMMIALSFSSVLTQVA